MSSRVDMQRSGRAFVVSAWLVFSQLLMTQPLISLPLMALGCAPLQAQAQPQAQMQPLPPEVAPPSDLDQPKAEASTGSAPSDATNTTPTPDGAGTMGEPLSPAEGLGQQTPETTDRPAALDPALPTRAQVQSALDAVRKDPNMPSQHTEKSLRFKHEREKKPKPEASPESGSAQWFIDLARWINQAGRLVVWVLGAIAVAFFLVGLRHWIKVRGDLAAPARQRPPSHVRDLDIRPESLPDQIGASAWALWQQGDHRSALSLLYRGALSRLVHVHEVPITAASTEGDCLKLARPHLASPTQAYVEELVQAWLVAVYGNHPPADAQVQSLCERFDPHLPARRPTPSTTPAKEVA